MRIQSFRSSSLCEKCSRNLCKGEVKALPPRLGLTKLSKFTLRVCCHSDIIFDADTWSSVTHGTTVTARVLNFDLLNLAVLKFID